MTFELYLVLMLRYHGKKQGKKNTEERGNAKRFFSSFFFKKKKVGKSLGNYHSSAI